MRWSNSVRLKWDLEVIFFDCLLVKSFTVHFRFSQNFRLVLFIKVQKISLELVSFLNYDLMLRLDAFDCFILLKSFLLVSTLQRFLLISCYTFFLFRTFSLRAFYLLEGFWEDILSVRTKCAVQLRAKEDRPNEFLFFFPLVFHQAKPEAILPFLVEVPRVPENGLFDLRVGSVDLD